MYRPMSAHTTLLLISDKYHLLYDVSFHVSIHVDVVCRLIIIVTLSSQGIIPTLRLTPCGWGRQLLLQTQV
jgi:hypothetical protein